MSIRVLRAPSESPNINNTDDFPGLRYAYGNRNGYVKGKGEELSYTINGSTLKIGSGRIVLQGVECDIDANGVSITVDNVASPRMYVVYLEVSLLSNTAAVKAVYDTSMYPDVDPGDDLNENTTGTARMVLYQFNAISGTISGVSQKIKELEYYPDMVDALEVDVYTGTLRAGNAKTAEAIDNQAVVATEGGNVITVGGKRMTRHRVLFAGGADGKTFAKSKTDTENQITLIEAIEKGDIIAFELAMSSSESELKIVNAINEGTNSFSVTTITTVPAGSPKIGVYQMNFETNGKHFKWKSGWLITAGKDAFSMQETGCTVRNVYKLYM